MSPVVKLARSFMGAGWLAVGILCRWRVAALIACVLQYSRSPRTTNQLDLGDDNNNRHYYTYCCLDNTYHVHPSATTFTDADCCWRVCVCLLVWSAGCRARPSLCRC